MRFSSRIVIFIVYLSLAVLSCATVHAGAGGQLPPEITRFYADYNFVAAFTTFEEGVALQGGRVVDAPPPDMNSPRMKEVQRRLNRLNARIVRSDPAIVVPLIKTAGTIPRGFLRITASRCGPNEMALRVTIQEIALPTRTKLIAAYEEAAPNVPSNEEIASLLAGMQDRSHLQIELHRWILTDEGWMKEEADVALVEESSPFIGNC